MHPFSRQERAVVWYCSTIFLFGWSLSEEAAAAFYAQKTDVRHDVSYFALLRPQRAATYGYLLVRILSVILFSCRRFLFRDARFTIPSAGTRS